MRKHVPSKKTRGRKGMTLVEVMLSSALLATSFGVGVASMVAARRESVSNNLRSVALFTAEQTVEQLRSVGREALAAQLQVDNSGAAPVWVYDPTVDGTVAPSVFIRVKYEKIGGVLVENLEDSVSMTQEVEVLTADNGGVPDNRTLQIHVDVSWTSSGILYRDSLYTILE